MKIEFINHSSIVLSHGDVHLMCDFWKSGRAFNEGWALLCDTPFGYEDFSRITHIWFSHEHPDHFSPGDLMKVAPEVRAKITVLFQQTDDNRVVGFCRKAGFKEVIELAPAVPLRLGADCEVTCAPFGAGWGDVDSWLLVKMGGKTLLNLNDCEVHAAAQAAPIKKICGDIDVLAAQFSYAARQGNPGDTARFDRAHTAHLDYFAEKVMAFKPRAVLPFASFVYWCCDDNRYLNDRVVRVGEVVQRVQQQGIASPLVMFPGDVWVVGDNIDNTQALARYESAYEGLATKEMFAPGVVTSAQLVAAAEKLIHPLVAPEQVNQVKRYLAAKHFDAVERAKYPGVLQRAPRKLFAVARKRVLPVHIFVSDLDACFALTLEHGLVQTEMPASACDIAIKSHALQHCLATAFGGETLQVSGRFIAQNPGGWEKLYEFCYLARRLEQKHAVPRAFALRRSA